MADMTKQKYRQKSPIFAKNLLFAKNIFIFVYKEKREKAS